MNTVLLNGRYKEISLTPISFEEYEKDQDNIGKLLVLCDKENVTENSKVIFNMSKEAMLGFGINLVRAAFKYAELGHSHIEPLGTLISNQAMGFFLTPESSELVIGCKSLGGYSDYNIKPTIKQETTKTEIDWFRSKLLVDLKFDNDYLEEYNIGLCNVGELKVVRKGQDISNKCRISLSLSKSGLLGFGTQLIRFVHRHYKNETSSLKSLESSNNDLGFLMLPEGGSIIITYKNFENVFYYDKDFGKR